MTGRILHFADLQRICSPDGPAPRLMVVCRWADREGIRYRYDRKGRIWTTIDAVNAALGIAEPAANHENAMELI
ncbi:hypothetical protein [Xanthomonas hortorum]|uniref:hypothetical protein n=1 Tax=Xanthomonas hortorum TaxID=56454 RepID=UPI002935E354|nr:hypothetical protein [Xanthomonas hortorum]MDV2452681.1 hypothetical protein [Xanthomonas hortorum NBC5720]